MAVPDKVLQKIAGRYSLSDFLPYVAYEDGLFVLSDGIGFMFECMPLMSTGMETYTILKGLFETDLPENTTIQISIMSSRRTGGVFSAWLNKRTDPASIYRVMAMRRMKHLTQERILRGMDYNLRDFRLFISIKMPMPGMGRDVSAQLDPCRSYRNTVEQILKTINLWPYPMDAQDLLSLMHEILSPGHGPCDLKYDPTEEIRKQMVFADNAFRVHTDHLELDGHAVVPLSVKQYPDAFHLARTNLLIGDLSRTRSRCFSPSWLP